VKGERSPRAQKLCFSWLNPKLDESRIKTDPKKLKFWGEEDDDFKNTSSKDFHEIPHGLKRIDENRSKSGVFRIFQKLSS